jgi:hypothetical protein
MDGYRFQHGKTWLFRNIILYKYNEEKSTCLISTIYTMTLRQKKIWHMTFGIIFNENENFIEILISTIDFDYSI